MVRTKLDNGAFRLYAGIEIDGDWYNYATLKDEIEGGTLSLLDSEDHSTSKKMKLMIGKSVDKLYTENGQEIEIKENQLGYIKLVDGWKFGMEIRKLVERTDYPTFQESFFCQNCSRPKRERYTVVEESWNRLIEDGILFEHYLTDPLQMRWETVLPRPVTLSSKGVSGGKTIEVITRELLNLDDLARIEATPELLVSEASYVYAIWDSEIQYIEGFEKRDMNVYVKNDLTNSFSRRYITNDENIDAMSERIEIGLDGTYRNIKCEVCGKSISGKDMGGLVFTNFFDFIMRKKSPRLSRGMGI
ncbi:MAG: hypothetical protein PF637_06055 [Spirochaetes bacterium]|nr:hypothetical protein [Spirochaetota bacterium]